MLGVAARRAWRGSAAALIASAALVAGALTPAPPALADPGPDPASDAASAGIDVAQLIGLAAIAGAGLEIRQVVELLGPATGGTLTLATPSGAAAGTPTDGAAATGGVLTLGPVAGQPGIEVQVGPSGGVQVAQTGPVRSLAGIPAAWHSGASGDEAKDGSFGAWRGSALQIQGTWSDTTADVQRALYSVAAYSGWDGDLDVAVGALAEGETWAQAASGAYVDRWTAAIRTLKQARSGHSGAVYVRFAHEMTGDWFAWKVNSGNVAAFKTAWRMFHGILVTEYPEAKLVFSPNDDNHSDLTPDQIWPGDDVVDVVGPDSYDGYPDRDDQASWDAWFSSTKNGPKGLGAWRAFATAHGKPMALPEWGLRGQDSSFYIKAMHDFLASCAPAPTETNLAGKCIYDIYFNIAMGADKGFVIYGGPNPNAAGTYTGLSWGTH